jgi:hypothetical protein
VTLPTPTVDRLADERLLADLATALFRAQRASDDAAPRVADDPAQRRPNARRHIDTAADALARAGVRTLDFTGRPYDPGLLGVQALAIEPRPGLTRETVIETVRPGVYVHDACIQEAQVLVGVPVAPVAGHPSTQETT